MNKEQLTAARLLLKNDSLGVEVMLFNTKGRAKGTSAVSRGHERLARRPEGEAFPELLQNAASFCSYFVADGGLPVGVPGFRQIRHS